MLAFKVPSWNFGEDRTVFRMTRPSLSLSRSWRNMEKPKSLGKGYTGIAKKPLKTHCTPTYVVQCGPSSFGFGLGLTKAKGTNTRLAVLETQETLEFHQRVRSSEGKTERRFEQPKEAQERRRRRGRRRTFWRGFFPPKESFFEWEEMRAQWIN